MIGYAFCGSFCTLSKSIEILEQLKKKEPDIIPIMSDAVYSTDTRFYLASDFRQEVEALCSHPIIHTVKDAEPLGPKIKLDALIIAPCTGNTLAKMANGITDTPVTMAAKAHLRTDRPLLIALASNDSLSANLKNISAMLMRKSVYFVPMQQDDVLNKPHSLVSDFSMLLPSYESMQKQMQNRPLFL